MFEKIECPWCHEQVFAPINDEKKMRTTNDINIIYKETMCPSCEKRITLIDDVHIKLMSSTIVRLDCENDKVVPMFAECGSKYHESILTIRRELDEALGKLRDEWDNPEPEDEKIKLILEATDGTKIESQDELEEYIRENFDEYDVKNWVGNEFGTIDIGPYSFEATDIIESMEGSFNDIVCETYECNYASDRVGDSEVIFFDEPTDPNNVDVPEDGESIEIAGLCFTYKHIKVEKDAD